MGYTTAFHRPQKSAIYDASITDNEKALVRSRKEATHKSWIRNFTTYKSAEQETGKFILGVVEDMWVRELKQANMYYTLVPAGQLLAHLKATCGVIYYVDFLTLQSKMHRYHLDSEGIPK